LYEDALEKVSHILLKLHGIVSMKEVKTAAHHFCGCYAGQATKWNRAGKIICLLNSSPHHKRKG